MPDKEKIKDFWREAWYAFISQPPPVRWSRGEYCCNMLRTNVIDQCSVMPDGTQHFYGQCPDQVVISNERGCFGLPVKDGGGSMIEINHCPWCGRRLPCR